MITSAPDFTLPAAWQKAVPHLAHGHLWSELRNFVTTEYTQHQIFPPATDLFSALVLTPPERVSVVILGQDPYPTAGHAHGLAFSVQRGIALPKSLQNIYKELQRDLGIEPAQHGNLTNWATQGVLLLNTVLTVREGKPGSHANKGWEALTRQILSYLNRENKNLVFMLWGRNAQQISGLLNRQHHLVLETSHPSPLGAYKGFLGCGHFSAANHYLQAHGKTPIHWELQP